MSTSYSEILDKTSISILRTVLNENIYVIYSPSVQVENGVIASTSFSLPIKNDWINFINDWKETPNDISYYKMRIELTDKPKNIEYLKDQRTFTLPVSSFLFNRGQSNKAIIRIEIYSKRELWDEESIFYDFALIFVAGNGFRLCISAREDITDQLECTIDSKVIDEIIQCSELREIIN